MRYRDSMGKTVKVDSSLRVRAPFKQILTTIKSCQFALLPSEKKLLDEKSHLVSEIGITIHSFQEMTSTLNFKYWLTNSKVSFEDGHKLQLSWLSSSFFKDLSRELGFEPPLDEQHLKDLSESQFCEKVHRMIAINALGVQPNKTANL